MPDTVRTSKRSLALTLDGVSIKLETPFLPGETFSASAPGDSLQAAVWSTLEPMSELTIVAAPFGSKPPTENVPTAGPGLKAEYYKGFDKAREMGEVYVLEQTNRGPKIRIFGKTVTGKATLAEAQSPTGGALTPVLTVEWVAEAGERIWIVRASHEAAPGTATLAALKPLLASLGDIVLRSNTLEMATTVPLAVAPPPRLAGAEEELVEEDMLAAGPLMAGVAANLPAPPWWNGVCNRVNFRHDVGRDSFPLGPGFRGVVPCGPLPGANGDRVVVFFPNAHGEFEFQCVELCMRYMKLAHDIDPYQGNGSQVVPHFATKSKMKDRGKMKIIPNGPARPAPVAGDILSYGATTTVGHTSVCIGSNVDVQGNGTITVLEQNNAVDGRRVLTVKHWQVLATPPVTSFLHPTSDGAGGGGGNNDGDVVDPTPVFFSETGQFVGHGFKQLWFKPGNGLFLCGFPKTSERAEGDLTVQYFENVKMEFRPGIQPRFGPVGDAYVQHPNSNVSAGTDPTGPGTRSFAGTGHSVGGDFLTLFDKYGEEVCGVPVTGEIDENGLKVQYFRNVRMEQTPGLPPRFGAVGTRFLDL